VETDPKVDCAKGIEKESERERERERKKEREKGESANGTLSLLFSSAKSRNEEIERGGKRGRRRGVASGQ